MAHDGVKYRLSDDALCVPVDGETTVLEMSTGRYFGIRGAMRDQFENLAGGVSLDDMVADTCSRYEVTAQAAREDLAAMLEQMLAAGIVQTA